MNSPKHSAVLRCQRKCRKTGRVLVAGQDPWRRERASRRRVDHVVNRSIYNTRSTSGGNSPGSLAASSGPSGMSAASWGQHGRRAGTTEGAGAPRRGCRARSWSGVVGAVPGVPGLGCASCDRCGAGQAFEAIADRRIWHQAMTPGQGQDTGRAFALVRLKEPGLQSEIPGHLAPDVRADLHYEIPVAGPRARARRSAPSKRE